MRAIFLGSAPGTSGKMARGIALDHILLGVAQPGQSLGHYQDALSRLRDRLNFLNDDHNRFWFGITPNLRREMETRKDRFNFRDEVLPELRQRVHPLCQDSCRLTPIRYSVRGQQGEQDDDLS